MPTRPWLIGAILLLILCLVPAGIDASHHPHKDTPGHGHGHPTPTPTPSPPIAVVVHDYTQTWSPYVQQSVADWNAAVEYRGISISYVREPYIPCEDFVRPPNTVAACESRVLGSNVQAGVAYGNYLVGGNIALYAIPDPVNGIPTYLTCHEFGHLWGLSHQPDGVESCMSPAGSCACDQSKPSALDADLAFRITTALETKKRA